MPFIPVKSRTRQNNTLNPEPQVFLEWLSFNWVEYFAKTQDSECQHHHPQAGHQAQHGGVRHLGTNFGKNGTLMGGKTKNGRTKGKERQRQVHAPHSLRKLLAWARTSTLSKSTCVLIPSCIADFFLQSSRNSDTSQLLFLAVSRPDSGNCRELDGWCRQHTCLYARVPTFFSCTHDTSLMSH